MKQWKKITLLFIAIISSFAFLILQKTIYMKFPRTYDFAVIDSTATKNKSFIYYYKSSGKKVYEQPIKMGYMGDTFTFPAIKNNKMYTIPWGIDFIRNLSVLFELDLETGKHSTYDTSLRSANSFDVTDKYFFTVNTMNSVSKIARTDRKKLITKIISFPNYYIGKIAAFGDGLYAFGYDLKMENCNDFIKINIETLKEELRINIHGLGKCPARAVLIIGNDLYFTLPYKNTLNGDRNENNNLAVFHKNTKQFSNIRLPENCPSELIQYQDNIIITHVDSVTNEGKSISIFNTKTNEVKKYLLKNTPCQIAIRKNWLYSLDIIERNICRYEIMEDGIVFKKMYKINKKRGREYYFLSGFFLR